MVGAAALGVARERLQHRLNGDGGVVAVWVAILVPVLIGFCALAVDVSRWYVEGERLQKSVDAGALAGAVFMPNDLGKATAAAEDTAGRNGNGEFDSITVEPGDRPSQLRVTASRTVHNSFGGIFGIGESTITRTAVAEYAGPAPMGSPCNVMGNENMETGTASQGKVASTNCDAGAGTYWLNISGKNVNKARGDAYQAAWCTKPDSGPIDGCASTSTAPPGVNAEYDPNGYVFTVRVRQAGVLQLQGFDIGYAAVGDNCDNGTLDGATTSTNPYVSAASAATRYAKGNTAFCTGDVQYAAPEGDGSIVGTQVTVRGESATPWNPLEGPVLYDQNFPGYSASTNYRTALTGNAANYQPALAKSFHRWADLLPTGGTYVLPGDYSIQVRSIGGGGQNRFALRATLNGGASTGVSIFGSGRAALYNSVPAGTSQFHLVRLDSSAAGHNLALRFFDLADATAPVNVTVLQPDTSSLNATQPFAVCQAEGPTTAANLSGCSVSTRTSTHGGKWQTVNVAVPGDYRCNADSDQSKCWVRVRLTTTSGQNDTTTWTAGLDGDPVRLVE